MIVLLSPSKTLDMEPATPPLPTSQPALMEESEHLAARLRGLSVAELQALMKLSDKLAQLNHDRYQHFSPPFTPQNAKAALLTFKGDVYEPMTIASYSEEDWRFADTHLRILSGLYGLLRPLDLIQPYRLEMGTPLKNERGRDLYAFWGASITEQINHALRQTDTPWVVNLASQEYFKAVQPGRIEGQVVTVCFKDQRGSGEPKVIGLYAKQARGLMADFIVRQRVTDLASLKVFNVNDYRFQPAQSDEQMLTFLRRH